jgi:tetratricopeptide (TPR) repeat protein
VSRDYLKKTISIFALTLSLAGANEPNISDDELIIRGIFYEQYGMYNYAQAIYDELYSRVPIQEYMFKKAKAAMLSGNGVSLSIKELEKWDKAHPTDDISKRLLIPLYLLDANMSKAKEYAKRLLQISNKPKDLEIASNPYLFEGDYQKALELLNEAYKQSHNESTLLQIVNIMQNYTKEYQKAIQLLEMHRRINVVVSKDVYDKLIELYVATSNVDGILQTYKDLYKIEQNPQYLAKILNAYVLKGDYKGAIEFFEKNKADDKILFDLYQHEKMYDKAFEFATQMYKKSKEPQWLAKKAIVIYDRAENKKDTNMIDDVIKYFDMAIKAGIKDGSYYNYYGYTLIDNDRDIQKGIKMIQQALKTDPTNSYYIDSLAWGYYKEHQCPKAYKLMLQISKNEIEETIELKEHYEAIKKCK